ncbi:MAG: formylmethanofuran dehydrogenase subunit A [Pirellulaceae bacterium]|nr:formylmethanofuran dehydrogenase subunit A [Pirellulaceae bacterium]
MLTRLTGAQLCDPQFGTPTEVRDLYLENGTVVATPDKGRRVDHEYKLDGRVLMAGAIDMHTHIGGGKVNLARLLLPERARIEKTDESIIRPLSSPVPGTWETGRRYLEMGYTTCFEPAILPANARHAHLEMADIPWLDTGGYLMLGNEDLLLEWISKGVPQRQINDYVGWMLTAHRCLAVKVVNAGGINAFKFNQRFLDVDDVHPEYRITPRQILCTLAEAIDTLGIAHPLHVHCSNLGVPGNIASTLATIGAVEGRRLHITHAQFHCYGKDGPHGFSSAANQLADRVNSSKQLSIDVGQVLFGQTVTISGDTMHQFAHRKLARPRKTIFQDLECQAGCGVLPFRYRQSQYVHGLQWAIGLELFLLVKSPYQVFLTTDHPNGAPFTGYPHLIRLLMDYDFRMSIFEQLHPDIKATSQLPSLRREYTLEEIAILTRNGPAQILGLSTQGHLQPGASGDVVVYKQDSNQESMFARPEMVFRRGKLIYRNGEFLEGCDKVSFEATPNFDTSIERELEKIWANFYCQSMSATKIGAVNATQRY